MHLVDEQHRLPAFGHQPVVGAFEHVAHVLDAGGDRGQFFEHTAGLPCHDVGERGLAHPGRAEQDDGAWSRQGTFRSGIRETAERRAFAQHTRLADDLVHA